MAPSRLDGSSQVNDFAILTLQVNDVSKLSRPPRRQKGQLTRLGRFHGPMLMLNVEERRRSNVALNDCRLLLIFLFF